MNTAQTVVLLLGIFTIAIATWENWQPEVKSLL